MAIISADKIDMRTYQLCLNRNNRSYSVFIILKTTSYEISYIRDKLRINDIGTITGVVINENVMKNSYILFNKSKQQNTNVSERIFFHQILDIKDLTNEEDIKTQVYSKVLIEVKNLFNKITCEIEKKIDKVKNATKGDIPILNSDGQLVDSGISLEAITKEIYDLEQTSAESINKINDTIGEIPEGSTVAEYIENTNSSTIEYVNSTVEELNDTITDYIENSITSTIEYVDNLVGELPEGSESKTVIEYIQDTNNATTEYIDNTIGELPEDYKDNTVIEYIDKTNSDTIEYVNETVGEIPEDSSAENIIQYIHEYSVAKNDIATLNNAAESADNASDNKVVSELLFLDSLQWKTEV